MKEKIYFENITANKLNNRFNLQFQMTCLGTENFQSCQILTNINLP